VLQTIQNRGVAELGLRWPKTNKKAQHQYQRMPPTTTALRNFGARLSVWL
jgi:hypothetical protein